MWNYADSVVMDENDTAYTTKDYGESDYFIADCTIVGRKEIEDGIVTFEDFESSFINVNNRALPSWVNPPEPWEERSCDFSNGWYYRHAKPAEVAKKLEEQHLDVIFQISSLSVFEIEFCVWTKPKPFTYELTTTCIGKSLDELVQTLGEIQKQLLTGMTSGFDSNTTSDYTFELAYKLTDKDT